MTTLIELRGVGLEVQKPVTTRILHPIDLDIPDGASVAIMGPSGAGKTTLASIIGALQSPTEGSYRFANHDVTHLPRRALAGFRAREIGFVFQNSHLVEERSAQANVELGITDPSVTIAERRDRSREALDWVGLGDVADRRTSNMSGGERHRVAIARALVKAPRIIIADEPTAALDQDTGDAILGLLAEATARGATVIVVTHDTRAATRADTVVRIVDGRLTEGALG